MQVKGGCKRYIALATLVLNYCFLLHPAKAQTNINSQDTLPIVIGISEYSRPISYDFEGVVGGYCADVIEALQGQGYKVQSIYIKLEERFKGRARDPKTDRELFLDAECGPNTITRNRIDALAKVAGQFSEVFAWTPYGFLIKQGKTVERDKTKFGVLGTGALSSENTTTTQLWLQESYGARNVQTLKDRDEVFKALKTNQIESYVNDEILLLGLLTGETGKFIQGKYELDQLVSSSNKDVQNRYGLIVYKANAENKPLLNAINALITNGQDVIIRNTTLKKLSSSKNLDSFEQQWKALQTSAVTAPTVSPTLSPVPLPAASQTSRTDSGDSGQGNFNITIISLVVLGLFGLLILAIRHGSINISQETRRNKIKGKDITANQDGDKNKIDKDKH